MSIFKRIIDNITGQKATTNDLGLNVLNVCKQNLLHTAIADQNNETALDLINKGIDINAKDFKGRTPLHFAAAYNNLVISKVLLEKGAEVNLRDQYGNNPLWTAVFEGQKIKYYDLVILLLDYDADVYNVNNAGKTSIDFAKQVGYTNLIEILERK